MGSEASLVERSTELTALAEAVAGGGVCAVVEGPAGIGKTALVTHALQLLPESTDVRLARASVLEQQLSGGVVLQLLASAVDEDGVFDGAAQGARSFFEPAVHADLPQGLALFHALHALCLNLARTRPLLLVVDDAQWADAMSLEFLAYLGRRVERTGVAVVLTVRTGETGAADRLLAEIDQLPDLLTIRPTTLTPDGARRVIRATDPDVDLDDVGEQWWRRAGGVPLFLVELAREHRRGEGANAPDSVVRLVHSRLTRLDESARRVAIALSVLGAAGTQNDVSELTDLSLEAVLAQLDELHRVELITVDPWEFTHPLLAEAVLASVPAGELAGLRLRAARLLQREAPSRAAAQLVALGPSVRVGQEWAASALHAAAMQATDRGGVAEAIEYLRQALEEPAANPLRFRILLDLGRLEAQRRDLDALRHFEQATSLAGSPLERARTALLHGEALFHFGELDQCSRVCLAAVAEVQNSHRELALQLHAMAFNADGVTGSRRDRLAGFQDEVATAATPGERAVLTHVVADAAARGVWDAKQVREAGVSALGDGALLSEVGAASPTYIFCGTALAWADEFDAVVDLTERGLEIGERSGSRMAIAYSSALHAGVLLRAGRLKDAEQSASRVVDELADADPMSYGIAVGWLVQACVEQGRVDDARSALENSGLDGPLPALGTVAFLMLARGYLYLAEGDAEAAEREFDDVGRIAQTSVYPNPAALAWRSARALALAELGHLDEAVELVDTEIELAREFGAGRATAIALQAKSSITRSTEERAELLEESVGEARRAGSLLELAKGLVELGRVLSADGDGRGRDVLAEGLDVADRCGSMSLSEDAKSLLRAIGARPRRPRIRGEEALTRQERRVSRLAARGHLNREIADELFVSIGTVEAHLTNAYKKLGIESRDELAAVLSGGSSA